MKGTLHKIEQGWMVRYFDTEKSYDVMYCGESLRLHPDNEDLSYAVRDSDWEGKEVEFEIVSRVLGASGIGQTFAKLIPSKESSYELEYNRYMKTFVNSNLNPPTIEQFVDKVNTDSDFAKYWGPGGKEQQKQLITEIMDLDAKDGLYDTTKETLYTEEDMLNAFYDGWLSKDLIWKVAKKLFKESLKQHKKD